MKFERWLIYTVTVAALPFLIRLICFWLLNNPIGFAVSPIDIVFFGLTLNISNINELNGLKNRKTVNQVTPPNKDRILGLSLLLIIFLTITLGIIYCSELSATKSISLTSTYICSILMSSASLVFSWNVMLKIQRCYGNN
ncbi:hypothetical protein NSB22_06350 [Parabacteroides distasonis]|uniref:Uncharacterized protein n=1 Tax=Parabacteroides distasonis TaxID=823 RepID=A0A174RV63_PARDI|nr:hypothetical protein [Parabacteroides distasonis]MCR1852406.1 hypothetical protein [Parabacteroides distasonis]CUP89513.1 Uncharacterised protein [Parabacteroides distasonis]